MAKCDACGKEFDTGFVGDWMAGDEAGRVETGTTVTASQKITSYEVTYADATPIPVALCTECYKERRSKWVPKVALVAALLVVVVSVPFAAFGGNDALWVIPVIPVMVLLAIGWEYLKKFAEPTVAGVSEVTKDVATEKAVAAGRSSAWTAGARSITPEGETALGD